MEIAYLADPEAPGKTHPRNLVPGLLLGCLVWRIVVVNALALAFPHGGGGWVVLGAEAPLYAAIALLIRETRGAWRIFHIDALSVGVFLAFGTLLRTGTGPSAGTAGLVDALVFLSLATSVVLSLRCKGAISWGRARDWVAWMPAVALGCISLASMVILPGAVVVLARSDHPNLFGALAVRYSLGFFQEMGHAAILEEPVFRGFLWGYLAQRGWNHRKILLAQAGLFWLAHLPRYSMKPQVLLLTLPAGALFYGWLAWTGRSVAPSMVAHAIYNALAGMF